MLMLMFPLSFATPHHTTPHYSTILTMMINVADQGQTCQFAKIQANATGIGS
jgi:hypothetical protein